MSGKTAEVIGDLAGVSRSLTQRFFKGKPISVENFQALCKALELDWEKIVELRNSPSTESRKRAAFVINGSVDKLDSTKLAKLQALVRALQDLTGDASIVVVDIEEGSIRLILEGSENGIERLKQLFDERELTEVLGTPVRDVESIESEGSEIEEDYLRNLLISNILSKGGVSANLSHVNLSGAILSRTNLSGAILTNADLSDVIFNRAILSRANLSFADLSDANLFSTNLTNADLRHANLKYANLTNADLRHANLRHTNLRHANLKYANLRHAEINETTVIDAKWRLAWEIVNRQTEGRNLSNADLSFANLSRANLSFANLSFANLSFANLSRANLSNANFNNAEVEKAQFGTGVGLSESQKHDLISRGAIFDETPGDRSPILTPTRR